jgi:hypothetical protein
VYQPDTHRTLLAKEETNGIWPAISEFTKRAGFFIMPQSWDRLFYFSSEGRHAVDFSSRKNPTASVGSEPAILDNWTYVQWRAMVWSLMLSKYTSHTNTQFRQNKIGISYLFTLWSGVLLERLTGSQLVMKFPTHYGTRIFITALTSVHHLFISWTSSIQSSPHIPLTEKSY